MSELRNGTMDSFLLSPSAGWNNAYGAWAGARLEYGHLAVRPNIDSNDLSMRLNMRSQFCREGLPAEMTSRFECQGSLEEFLQKVEQTAPLVTEGAGVSYQFRYALDGRQYAHRLSMTDPLSFDRVQFSLAPYVEVGHGQGIQAGLGLAANLRVLFSRPAPASPAITTGMELSAEGGIASGRDGWKGTPLEESHGLSYGAQVLFFVGGGSVAVRVF